MNILIVGAGLMGSQIACEYAIGGHVVSWRRIGENLLPELSDARDLAGLERWLLTDESALTEARRRRDERLAAELIDERRSSGGQAGGDR